MQTTIEKVANHKAQTVYVIVTDVVEDIGRAEHPGEKANLRAASLYIPLRSSGCLATGDPYFQLCRWDVSDYQVMVIQHFEIVLCLF